MRLDLLDTPLRLTWEIPGLATPLARESLCLIAGRIAEAGIFYVTMEIRPLLNPAWTRVMEILLDAGCQVRLGCHGSAEELQQMEQLAGRPVELLLDVAPFVARATHGIDGPALSQAVQSARRLGLEPTLSLTPLRSNLLVLPALLQFCQDRKVQRLRLPNANIGASFGLYLPDDLPRWQDLELFAAIWKCHPFPVQDGPALEIHDLFLWEILTPDNRQARTEYGGCQAANSLGHIDAYGQLHPCAAWPEPFGSLIDSSLEQLWHCRERFMVRQRIGQTPAGCSGCRDLPVCFGGCRGLALALNRDHGERDLMCPAPR